MDCTFGIVIVFVQYKRRLIKAYSVCGTVRRTRDRIPKSMISQVNMYGNKPQIASGIFFVT